VLLLLGPWVGVAAQADAPAKPKGEAVQAAKGWRFGVFARDLPSIDNIVVAYDGAIYATQELADGKGTVVRIRKGEAAEVVLANLNRADGLFARGRYLYVTEEVMDGRVIQYDLCAGVSHVLATLRNPEGIDMLPDGDLVVSEDSVNGRIVRIKRNGVLETIMAGLNRPEGIAVAKDGTVYIAETATGRVLAYRRGDMEDIVQDLDEPDQVELAPDGALWITEDAKPGRLLRYYDGALDVVLTGVSAPQGIAFFNNGTVLVAEQGTGRILAVSRIPAR
jgi:sugar lactone lactonase YvrE